MYFTLLYSTLFYCTSLKSPSLNVTLLYSTSVNLILLYSTSLYCPKKIYFIVLNLTLLYLIVLHFTILYFIVLYFTLLYFTALQFLYSTLLYCTLLDTTSLYYKLWVYNSYKRECHWKFKYRTWLSESKKGNIYLYCVWYVALLYCTALPCRKYTCLPRAVYIVQ